MAKARIALAICGWGWILAMGLWCAGKTRHFRAGCKAGALRRCAGDALVLQAMQGLHLTADLHGCRRARRRIAAGGPVVPWVCGHGAGPGGCDRDGAARVASPIICRSALAIEA